VATWGQDVPEPSTPPTSVPEPSLNGPMWPTVPASPPPAPRQPRRRWATVLAVLLAVVVIGAPVGLAVHQAGGYFVFSPGTAPVITVSSSCKSAQGNLALPGGAPCVHLTVPAGKAHRLDGELMMVDVEVSQAGPLDWARYELGLLGKQRQLVPVAAYAGSTPTSELSCQDSQQMLSADQDAAVAALAELHYKVTERSLGAQVNAVLGGTPAWSAGVHCGDVITAVGGKQVRTAQDLTRLLGPLAPGTTVTLTDRPGGGAKAKTVRARLARPPASLVAQGFDGRSYLGVQVSTQLKPVLPFRVSVDAGAIGGPSAGLAFTLAIIDTLSNGRLTGGHRVAATGTIAPDGSVGDVGGVQEKTAAVEKAGAQIFFVPALEYGAAKAVAGRRLQVIGVTSLAQALGALEHRYGGVLPAAHATGR
jgi:PDZ domain-containing protein